MDENIRDLMKSYYDERAIEYELIFQGSGPASVRHPEYYKDNARKIGKILHRRLSGTILDFACGTGYWIPFYIQNCRELTLVDQSENMLRIATRKNNTSIPIIPIHEDIYSVKLKARYFDCILAGFIFSHVEPEQEVFILKKLLYSLKRNGLLVIVDSAWSPLRQASLPEKCGNQQRRLENGKEFSIYKRYFEKSDFINLGEKVHRAIEVVFEGEVFIAAQIENK